MTFYALLYIARDEQKNLVVSKCYESNILESTITSYHIVTSTIPISIGASIIPIHNITMYILMATIISTTLLQTYGAL